MSINQDADLAEFLMARNRRQLKLHPRSSLVTYPRSPIVTSPAVSKAIDLSGIFRMSADEIDAALAVVVA